MSCCLLVVKVYNNDLAYEKIEENFNKNSFVNQDEKIEVKIKTKEKNNETLALNMIAVEPLDSYINLKHYSFYDNKKITILDEILSQKISILYVFLMLAQEGLLIIFKMGAM